MVLTLVSLTAKSSGDYVGIADGASNWGKVGSIIPQSKYRRDYCFICGEPIRVSPTMIGFPNSCSFCQLAYRGSPGVTEAERMFWIRETWELAEVISA